MSVGRFQGALLLFNISTFFPFYNSDDSLSVRVHISYTYRYLTQPIIYLYRLYNNNNIIHLCWMHCYNTQCILYTEWFFHRQTLISLAILWVFTFIFLHDLKSLKHYILEKRNIFLTIFFFVIVFKVVFPRVLNNKKLHFLYLKAKYWRCIKN